jgi:hypothetical protein
MIIYSLDTHSIIKEIAQFAQEDNNPVLITRIQSNHKIIALVDSNNLLYIQSNINIHI